MGRVGTAAFLYHHVISSQPTQSHTQKIVNATRDETLRPLPPYTNAHDKNRIIASQKSNFPKKMHMCIHAHVHSKMNALNKI